MEGKRRGNLFVLSGPSGTGKGAICAGLSTLTDAMLSVSMTTRAPRENEVDGESYCFVDKDSFSKAIAEDGLIEYAEVFGEYYGTPKAPVIASLCEGRDVILEIEVHGAKQVRERMPEAVLVFVSPPSLEELKKRIEGRGTESPERIEKRLDRVSMEVAQIENYDYLVINNSLESAIDDIHAIMKAEKLRVGEDTKGIISKCLIRDKK